MNLNITLAFSFQSFISSQDETDNSLIQNAANTIVNAITKRQNSTVMLAVTEVKIETIVIGNPPSGMEGYLHS